jgi:hypothetical protein
MCQLKIITLSLSASDRDFIKLCAHFERCSSRFCGTLESRADPALERQGITELEERSEESKIWLYNFYPVCSLQRSGKNANYRKPMPELIRVDREEEERIKKWVLSHLSVFKVDFKWGLKPLTKCRP